MDEIKEKISKYKNALVVVFALFSMFYVYQTFFASDDVSTAVSGETRGTVANQEAVREIIVTLNQLNVVRSNFDLDIIEDPRFAGLQDFSQSLPEQRIGKQNPFQDTGIIFDSNLVDPIDITDINPIVQ